MMIFKRKISLVLLAVASIVQLAADPLQWSTPPVTLSTTGVDASSARIVIDSNGNATAAWVEGTEIKSSSQPVGGSWNSASTLSGTGADFPSLGIASNGDVFALWLEGGVVKSAILPFGGSWGTAAAVSDTGASEPVLAVDASGNAIAVWERGGYIESATLLAGGSFGSVSLLSDANSDNPSVAIGADGTALAIWHTLSGGSHILVSSTMTIGNGWGSPITVISNNASHNYPAIAVDPFGNAAAIWYTFRTSGNLFLDVRVVTSDLLSGSSTWTTPEVLSEICNFNPANFIKRIGFNTVGSALAFWTITDANNAFNTESAVRPFGGSWITGGQIDIGNVFGYDADVAITSQGDSVALYMFYNGSSLMLQCALTDIGGVGFNSWSIPLNVSSGTSNAFPRIALTQTGTTLNAVGVWMQNDGANTIIKASTGTASVLLPPSNLAVVQSSNDLGVFTEYFNTLSWTASTDPFVTGYTLYRNGFFWTQVYGSTLSAIDHNAVQNGSITYGVASFNDAMDSSEIMTVSFP